MELLKARILAFLMDYLIMIIYIGTLLAATLSCVYFFNLNIEHLNPVKAQLLGFITLTVPVFLYFYLNEIRQGTLGKKRMKIRIEGNNKAIFWRNVFKFLPWEIAHTGVQWIVYFSTENTEPPFWVWVLLIIPQLMVFAYLISLILNSKKALYDRWAGTSIESKVL